MKVVGGARASSATEARGRRRQRKGRRQPRRSVTRGWRVGAPGEAGLKETPRGTPQSSPSFGKMPHPMPKHVCKEIAFSGRGPSACSFFVVMRTLQRHGEDNKSITWLLTKWKRESLDSGCTVWATFHSPTHPRQGLQNSETPGFWDSMKRFADSGTYKITPGNKSEVGFDRRRMGIDREN